MNPQIDNLLSALWRDFDHPDVWWQIVILLLCLGIAKLASRSLRDKPLVANASSSFSVRLGQGGIKRVAFPLMAAALVYLSRVVLKEWHPVTLLSIAIPLLLSMAAIRAVFYVLRYSFNPTGWVASLERSFALLVWILVALHITGLLPQLIDLLESVKFAIGKQQLNLWVFSQGIVTVIVTLLGALWVSGLIDARLMRTEGMDGNLRVVFSRVSKAVLMVIAVLVALPLVGIDLTTLSVFGGALGVGLGFGLQKIASNYVAGFIILLDRSIRIGNIISVSGLRGKVERITTRYTVLRNVDGNEAIVPNEMIISSTVMNEGYMATRMKIQLRLRITYASDLALAMRLMEEAAGKQEKVLKEPKPVATAVDFGDLGVFIELTCWIVEPEKGGWQQLRSDIGVDISQSFKAAGIELR